MNERVLVLREAVVKITQMLSGKGIQVTQRGVNAYVQCDRQGRPTLVNLPYLPDNATEELILAIQGFLDHEVAHIMFSNFDLLEVAAKAGVQSMLNMLEDPRIEKCMAKRFTGSGLNLSNTGRFFLDKYTTPMLAEAAAAGDANKAIAVLMVPLIRAMSGQYIFKEYIKDKMDILQPIYDKIADLAPRIEAAASTEDCLALAKEIEARLRSGKPSEGKGEKKAKKEEGGDASGSGKTKSKGKKSDEEDAPTTAGEGGGEEGEDEASASGAATGDEEESDEEEEEGEGEKSDEDEEKDEKPDAGEEDDEEEGDDEASGSSDEPDEDEEEGASADESDDESEDAKSEAGNAAAIWEAIDKEGANSFDASMSNLISNAAVDAAKHSTYLIYTKEGDLIEPLNVGSAYDPRMLADLCDKVDHMVGPLQKDLERAIAARSLATWEAGRRSGRLHAANLSRLAVGDGRVFRRRHETTSKDVAVSLVVDASGSMAGSKIHLATQSAYALSSVLERIGISHEVIAFTTGMPPFDTSTLRAESYKIGRSFSRIESLYMPIIKGFNERLKTEVKERFGWLPNSRILRNNVDGECVEIAARRLLGRRESGKVMIVLSDGAPNANGDHGALNRHLKKVVKDVTSAGVKVVGIGIESSEVEHFYPKSLVINNVAELPDRVIKELRHLLVS